MTGIIAALENEVGLIKAEMREKKTETVCGIECTAGKLFGKDAVVIKSGIGKVSAATACAVAISVFGASEIINTGFAAGKYPIGTLMLAERCAQHDFDLTALGLKPGHNDEFESEFFYADKELNSRLASALKESGLQVRMTDIASGDAFVADKAKMEKICGDFGACGVEMEGGAIAQVCTRAKVPFAVLRAVSDGGDSFEDYKTFSDGVAKFFSEAIFAYFKTL